jgi:hypothetical protein
VDRESIKQFVQENPKVVMLKETSKPGMFVLKYKKTVFFNNLWNDFLEECRGTVVDADFNIISFPFRKIYNYGVESKAPVFDGTTYVNAFRKVNGFMAAITWHNNELLVSTTGSLDSDFVKRVYDLIDVDVYSDVCKRMSGYTFIFECVHPDDPHIIPEQPGMYLLGWRHKSWGSIVNPMPRLLDSFALKFNCFRVESMYIRLDDLLKLSKSVKHEGFVFYTKEGNGAKIKSPYYLVSKAFARKKDIMSLNKQNVDEEYYPVIEQIHGDKEYFNSLDEQGRLWYIRRFLES